MLLAAVEPAAAEGGEEAGKRRHCDDEVPRISLGEHSLSFRWVLPVLPRVRPERVIGHPRTGDPRGLELPGLAVGTQRYASIGVLELVRLRVPRPQTSHQMAL